jgi:OFA family oxalate/formate antiporter-like MFS transporter
MVFGGTGVGEVLTFRVLSVVFLTVCSVGSFFMKNPPKGYMADDFAANPVASAAAKAASVVKSYSTREMLLTPQFYLTIFTLLLACMGGLMMIGFARPIAVARGLEATATIGVLAVSLFNSVGRLFWGAISDKLGRINTILVMLFGSAVLSLLVNVVNGYFIYILIALIGFFYGGIIGTFPSLTADLFGAKHMATNYGVVLLGFGVGAIISSQIAGYYKNVAATDISLMFPAFVIASCFAAAGIVMMFILKAINKRAVG